MAILLNLVKKVAHNDSIVSFTVDDEVVNVFIDTLHFLIFVAGSR